MLQKNDKTAELLLNTICRDILIDKEEVKVVVELDSVQVIAILKSRLPEYANFINLDDSAFENPKNLEDVLNLVLAENLKQAILATI